VHVVERMNDVLLIPAIDGRHIRAVFREGYSQAVEAVLVNYLICSLRRLGKSSEFLLAEIRQERRMCQRCEIRR